MRICNKRIRIFFFPAAARRLLPLPAGKNPANAEKVEVFLEKTLAFLCDPCYNRRDLRVSYYQREGTSPLFLIEKGKGYESD